MKLVKPVKKLGRVTRVESSTKRKAPSRSPREKFLYKYEHLEDYIDKLNSIDILYYFQTVAQENGYRYSFPVSDITKIAHTIKLVLKEYSPREVCGMISFLYNSEQDYLDKSRLSPYILHTSWVNSIYPDSQLWIEDKYVPHRKKKEKSLGNWSGEVKEEVTIGEKL